MVVRCLCGASCWCKPACLWRLRAPTVDRLTHWGEDDQDHQLASRAGWQLETSPTAANVSLRKWDYSGESRLNYCRFGRTTNFEGGVVPITYCKGRQEVRMKAFLNCSPAPWCRFRCLLKLPFKTSSLKPAQKFPATAYSDIKFSSPLLF